MGHRMAMWMAVPAAVVLVGGGVSAAAQARQGVGPAGGQVRQHATETYGYGCDGGCEGWGTWMPGAGASHLAAATPAASSTTAAATGGTSAAATPRATARAGTSAHRWNCGYYCGGSHHGGSGHRSSGHR